MNCFPTIKDIKEEPIKLTLEIDNINRSFLNTIRRILLTEIPSISFEKVIFTKNSSKMNEDFLGHRISLLPLVCQDIDSVRLKKDCNCFGRGCQFCETEFVLSKKNTEEAFMNVYCNDFETLDVDGNVSLLTYKRNGNGILLTILGPNEEIELRAITSKGSAACHSKWSVINTCRFKEEGENYFLFEIETNENQIPKKVFSIALKIYISQLEKIKEKINFDYEEEDTVFTFPFTDTIMGTIVFTICQNYSIDVCLYKRNHFLEEPSSDIIFNHFSKRMEKTNKDILLESINLIKVQVLLLQRKLSINN